MNLLDRVKRLNIFARLADLEARERERDLALDLMILNLEHIESYIEDRIKAVEVQNKKLSKMTYSSLDIKADLDVN